jgi:hypothetical protein
MATFTHSLQGTTATEISATDKLQFAAATFDSKITVDAYNDSTHVKTSANADKSSSNTPRNNKYLTSSTVSINGAASKNLNTATDAECALKINFADASSISLESAIFYAYDGSTTTVAPSGLTVQAAEQGDSSWSSVGGSAAALALGDKTTPGTSHDYFILVSATPTSVGAKTGKYRIELTYF